MNLKSKLSYQPVELSFGTSGLRGLVTDMRDLECYINSRGFLEFLIQEHGLRSGETVALGGDLRKSTPRILQAVAQAITDAGFHIDYCGLLPTPALAYWAAENNCPCIMVTGSHIPDDRNGIKFYKADGEVLKSDEAAIKNAVKTVRQKIYDSTEELFNAEGALISAPELPEENTTARDFYLHRFLQVFSPDHLKNRQIIVYQHSAVGRDLLVSLLEAVGAEVVPVERSDVFIPIDTENVTEADQQFFTQLAQKHPKAFAIVSTDGDSDRPFVVDETGEFHRGDVLGLICARELKADFAAIPVSSSDAVDTSLSADGVEWQHTKIGSPYVIEAMQSALSSGKSAVVGWEVNGGFLTGGDVSYGGKTLKALATRDAFLPIVLALSAAINQECKISELFAKLPARFTQAGLIDNFAQEDSQNIIATLSQKDERSTQLLEEVFTPTQQFGTVKNIDTTDGVRIYFSNNEIAHIRPSGNAPQLRIYSVAASQERADEIVALGIAEPAGLLRKLQKLL